MKKLFYILTTISIFFVGCNAIDQFTQFDMEYDATFTVPSSVGVNLPFNVASPDMQTNSESTFAVNDTRKDLVEEILLTTLDLTLSSPSNGDFSFLDEIRIYMSAEGLNEIEIAWKTDIPDSIGANLSLNVTDIDLKEYIKKDEFDLRLYTVTDEILTSDHTIDMHSVFYVDAKVFGQ